MAKTDMERVGLFSEQGYTTISDPYVPPTGSKLIKFHVHSQLPWHLYGLRPCSDYVSEREIVEHILHIKLGTSDECHTTLPKVLSLLIPFYSLERYIARPIQKDNTACIASRVSLLIAWQQYVSYFIVSFKQLRTNQTWCLILNNKGNRSTKNCK